MIGKVEMGIHGQSPCLFMDQGPDKIGKPISQGDLIDSHNALVSANKEFRDVCAMIVDVGTCMQFMKINADFAAKSAQDKAKELLAK